jgi:hypothetical protein
VAVCDVFVMVCYIPTSHCFLVEKGGSELTRGRQKTPGPKPKYNRAEILRGFQLGLSNVNIAENVGCTTGYVWELRRKEERRKKLRIEGRL